MKGSPTSAFCVFAFHDLTKLTIAACCHKSKSNKRRFLFINRMAQDIMIARMALSAIGAGYFKSSVSSKLLAHFVGPYPLFMADDFMHRLKARKKKGQ